MNIAKKGRDGVKYHRLYDIFFIYIDDVVCLYKVYSHVI